MTTIAVFCGANLGARPAYADAARGLGAALARRGLDVVYGGGGVGLMGTVAHAVLEAGGRVVGVIPDHLVAAEVGEVPGVETEVVRTMHQRKERMFSLADGIICLPGGYGTLDELFEGLTWTQLGLHQLAVGLYDVEGYWAPLVRFLDHAVTEGFVKPAHRATVVTHADPEELLDAVLGHQHTPTKKWT